MSRAKSKVLREDRYLGRKTQRGSEQKLIDIMFEVAMTAAKHLHGKSNEEIAEWVSKQLKDCGYPTTPICASWGVLDKTDT